MIRFFAFATRVAIDRRDNLATFTPFVRQVSCHERTFLLLHRLHRFQSSSTIVLTSLTSFVYCHAFSPAPHWNSNFYGLLDEIPGWETLRNTCVQKRTAVMKTSRNYQMFTMYRYTLLRISWNCFLFNFLRGGQATMIWKLVQFRAIELWNLFLF